MWDDELEEAGLYELAGAYMRRQKWEARLWATELVNALAEALGNVDSGTRRKRVSAGEFLRVTGQDG